MTTSAIDIPPRPTIADDLPVATLDRPSDDSRGPAPGAPPSAGRRNDRLGNPLVEIVLSLIGLVATSVAIVGTVTVVVGSVDSPEARIGAGFFLLMIGGLMMGSVAFLLSRLGFNIRRLVESPARLSLAHRATRSLLVLVPSYREEPNVVRQTLISAALQTYPRTHVVLLIDDPPTPEDDGSRQLLEGARALPDRLTAWFDEIRQRSGSALEGHRSRSQSADVDIVAEIDDLVAHLRWAAAWLQDAADREQHKTHTDDLFVARVLRAPADDMDGLAADLCRRRSSGTHVSLDELRAEYERLAHRFDCSFSTFERKRFENLSREPNKAMNLNSYLTLLGGRWREELRNDGLHLLRTAGGPFTLEVPRPDYVITLDADSIIEADYATTLAEFAERPDSSDVAVVQTPYSAIPGADVPLERIAGATTDIQYLIHQGFGYFGAAFWVGANALIRPQALDDLRTVSVERGHEIERFVSDRTVIEDTESSLDLAACGWRIHNHPDRLSYSATPPDFGSLIIQRRRWANGGLILTPKLRLAWRRNPINMIGLFLRSHYLVSIAATNVALAAMLITGFGSSYASWWLPAAAAPYVILYTRDLGQAGYRRRDMVSVYALNLLLMPANLAGVVKSLDQAIRRSKTPFARTPKVEGRTPASPMYHLVSLALLIGATITATLDLMAGHHAHAAFAGANAALLAFAVTAFVGWRALAEDIRVGLAARRPRNSH